MDGLSRFPEENVYTCAILDEIGFIRVKAESFCKLLITERPTNKVRC